MMMTICFSLILNENFKRGITSMDNEMVPILSECANLVNIIVS